MFNLSEGVAGNPANTKFICHIMTAVAKFSLEAESLEDFRDKLREVVKFQLGLLPEKDRDEAVETMKAIWKF